VRSCLARWFAERGGPKVANPQPIRKGPSTGSLLNCSSSSSDLTTFHGFNCRLGVSDPTRAGEGSTTPVVSSGAVVSTPCRHAMPPRRRRRLVRSRTTTNNNARRRARPSKASHCSRPSHSGWQTTWRNFASVRHCCRHLSEGLKHDNLSWNTHYFSLVTVLWRFHIVNFDDFGGDGKA
jgi:hypothetical protein